MTSITLPLKKIPGQTQRVPTFFGGRSFITPLILLLSISFTSYLYFNLSRDSLPLYNLLGLLPYLWGIISIVGCIRKSRDSVELLLEADLDSARRLFVVVKNYFRNILISTISFFIILIIIFSYLLAASNQTSSFVIVLNSIISVGITLTSFFSQSDGKKIFVYACPLCAVEAIFLFLTFKGLWAFNLILLFVSSLGLFISLHQINGYDLRSFFEMMVN
jgi:hypothetical protein